MDKLISILEENSDFTPEELASMTGLSVDEVRNKVKKFEDEGVIRGYQAVVDWEKVEDAKTVALIELKVAPQKDSGFEGIASHLCEYKEVISVYLMAGPYDLLLTVNGRSIQEISNFVAKKIAPMDGILSTATYFMLKRYKEDSVLLCDLDEIEDSREQVL